MSDPVQSTERPMIDPRRIGEDDDIRGQITTRQDRSEHRRHTWLYEDLLA